MCFLGIFVSSENFRPELSWAECHPYHYPKTLIRKENINFSECDGVHPFSLELLKKVFQNLNIGS